MENLEDKYVTTLERNFVNQSNAIADRVKFPSHWERYDFAKTFTKGKKVLDVACGSGYGTDILCRESGLPAIGLDIDAGAVEWANNYYGRENLRYIKIENDNWPIEDGSIDLVVSFETIEHCREPENFLKEISRVLSRDGQLLISTPFNDTPGRFHPDNEYHLREYNWQEFDDLLSKYFKVRGRYSQISNISSLSAKVSEAKLGGLKKMIPPGLKKFILNLLLHRSDAKAGRITEGFVGNMNVQIRLLEKINNT